MSRLSNLSGSGGVITVPTTILNTNPALPAITINPAPLQAAPLILVNGDIQLSGSVNAGTNLTAAGNVNVGINVLLYGNTPATALVNVAFGAVIIQGNYWDGVASQVDNWTYKQTFVPNPGANPLSVLTLTHAGSPGGGTYNIVANTIQYNGVEGSQVLKKIITLTAAQIKTLFTVPTQILPAPGANKTYMIHQTLMHYRFNTTAFGIAGINNLALTFSTVAQMIWFMGSPTGFLDQAVDTYLMGTSFQSASTTVVNSQLLAACDVANPTLGDGTLTIELTYEIVDVTRLT